MFELHIYTKDDKTPKIKEYIDYAKCKVQGERKLLNFWDVWLYEITDNGQVIFSGLYNYNPKIVVRDLRGYANCVRSEIGGGELEHESFLWLKHHGYITFAGKSKGVYRGLWNLSDKFREVGNKIKSGEYDSPPEFVEVSK